ncbi:MAG TPA: hypothetical protein VIC58_06495 [Actinomycetota bacterium]|jgi:hypothetical protein
MQVPPVSEPISVRARFERFPATLKGAFIFRGEDANPHQVVVERARVASVGAGPGAGDVPIAATTLDVVPHRDVFVPFELPISELEPGWYTLVCDLEIDGTPSSHDGGRRFSIPWPRATVRRGAVKVGRAIAVGDATVQIDSIDCTGDSIRFPILVAPAGAISVKLTAEGRKVEVLDIELDEATGRGKVTAYPLLRSDTSLRIEIRGRRRGAEGSLVVRLD